MALRLTITSFHRHSPGQETDRALEGERLTIGRAQDNDWVLEDPERVVSSHHCYLEQHAGTYTLTDTSTNGVFVNHSQTRVPRNTSVNLVDGDQLRLGQFELAVSVSKPSPSATAETDHLLPELDLSTPPQAVPTESGSVSERKIDPPAWDEPLPIPSSPDTGLLDQFPGGAAAIPDDYDPLAASWHGGPPPPLVQPNHTPPEQAHFRPPEARSEAIPTDWESLLADPDTEEQRIPPGVTDLEPPASTPVSPKPIASEQAGREIAPSPAEASAAAADALAAFLRGLGLDHARVQADPVQALENAGRLFRDMAQGTMEILMARSQLKSEFRMAQTIIKPAENNPLKFSLSVEDALEKLLVSQSPGHLPPQRAVREALTDIKAHQLAVVAGMQAAIKHLLKRFDPELLSPRLGEQGVLENLMPAGRKARMWDRFNALYEEIAREAEDDFQELFGKEFARAYEEYTRKQ